MKRGYTMLMVLSAGIAPGLALLSYFYLKDQFNPEPIRLVLKTFLLGSVITFPIMFIQHVLTTEHIFEGHIANAFLATSLPEEFFKWFIVYFIIFHHDQFNEPYDGIVYCVSVSLGFATVENILYILANGLQVALGRAFMPVSSHALFGVIMGYYFGKGKFTIDNKRASWLLMALIIPYLFHGFYDYIFLTEKRWFTYIIPFMLFLWWLGMRKVKHARHLTRKLHEKVQITGNQNFD
jgi:RsiW-degrading membrane proteinase PrsW (M82 family)